MHTSHPSAPAGDRSRLLSRITDELLSPRENDERSAAAVATLYSLCSAVTGLDEGSLHAADSEETGLPTGKAVSPRDAARCVLDFRRTSRFLRGIHAAVLEARRRFPGTKIEVLYAGCGPFAPLALPLTSRFSPAEVSFTLLDVHERSLDAARLVFEAFGAAAFVRDYVRCDAASYRHDASRDVHVVVVEAMQAALEKEPQVAITMNLAPQLRSGGIFIPERIAVDCHLCDPTAETAVLPRAGAGLGRVLELTADVCRGVSFPPKVVLEVPDDINRELNLMLSTTITVFDSVVLDRGESGLTCPRILFEVGKVHGAMSVEVAYRLGGEPGFEVSLTG